MGKALKLVRKLTRRSKNVKAHATKEFDRYDKMDRREENMAKSQKAYQLQRKIQRRLDRNLGIDMVRQKPKVSKRVQATTLERFDYGGSVFGIRATFPSGIIRDIGLQPGDTVRVLSGNLKAHYLEVVAITNSIHVQLEDDLSMADPGTAEKSQVIPVADVAGDTSGESYSLNSANDATAYYVWNNVDGAGVDPLETGTAVPVVYASNASAATIAAAHAAAINALGDFNAAVESGTKVIITNAAVGPATDAADNDSGFAISTLTQGSAADPTLSDSNVHCRFQLSDVKASHN